ncbi:hypothetical protein ACWGJ2_26485 [Streptomyces sp. NPDC054796]
MMARRARLLGAATTTAAVLTVSLSGCVTVNGEAAVIPAVSKGEAQKVLEEFTAKSNKANRDYDARLNTTIETGALGAIDQAGLISRKKVSPEGAKDYEPLKLSDARFLIPKQAGWPKFFVADTRSNRSESARWVFVFQRDGADADWKASYLSAMAPEEFPEFATDKKGHVKAVPTGGGSKLSVEPDELSKAYTRYLQDGSGDFADGTHTSERRAVRERTQKREGVRTEYADQEARPPQYAPFGLRTKDGGAMVWFASHHHTKETYAKGHQPPVKNPLVKALMTGTPKQAVTYIRVSEQVVTVPPAKEGGDITFLNQIDGLTSAKGE